MNTPQSNVFFYSSTLSSSGTSELKVISFSGVFCFVLFFKKLLLIIILCIFLAKKGKFVHLNIGIIGKVKKCNIIKFLVLDFSWNVLFHTVLYTRK